MSEVCNREYLHALGDSRREVGGVDVLRVFITFCTARLY